MNLSDQETELVHKAFNLARSEELFAKPTLFYEKLFAREPKLRAMFRDDIAGQGMRFMTTLKAIVAAVGDPGKLEEALAPLGQTHKSLGVVAAQFEVMGEALVDTFRELLDDDFTPEMEAAWRKAYGKISKAMIAIGAKSNG